MSDQPKAIDDLGTPRPRAATTQVSLEIDGRQLQVEAGSSVMRAAALAGINIPKLCATDSLDAFGSCRMCPRHRQTSGDRLQACFSQADRR